MPPSGLAAALMFTSGPRDRFISILQCGSPEVCRFLGRLHHKTILPLPRQASEKRQGTKSRCPLSPLTRSRAMTEPYFPLPVRAFSAVGFDSRKGQPLESRASRDLRDTACCARAAGVSRSGRSLPMIRTLQELYFRAWPPACPVSLSSSIPPRPIPPPSNWRNGMVWSRCSRLHACIQRDPPLGGLIAVSVLRLSSSVRP